ncbi:hypothetical protein D3C81_700850 [compost metagenome]
MTTPTQQAIEDFQSKVQAISKEKVQPPFRPHLGMSIIGDECARKLWYEFRWTTQKIFPPNIIRLFDRGHREEERFVGYLESVGIKVQAFHPETGKQFSYPHADGHMGGSLDGFGFGFKEYPNEWVVLEFKTHKDKSFQDMMKKGVKKSKPVHWSQMQMYMGKSGMTKAYYMAVNKNDDELYTEWVMFDKEFYEERLALGEDVVYGAIPERIALSSSDHRCRFCDHRPVCWHRSGAEPAHNCRTCKYSVPNRQGTWTCEYSGAVDIDCFNPCGAYTKRDEYVKPHDIIIALG